MRHVLIHLGVLLAIVAAPSIAAAPDEHGDPIRGGRMWDRWWLVTGDAAPTGTHWLYPETAAHAGPDSFRCKECHGWDYKGASGVYRSGTHFTGIRGVLDSNKSASDLFQLLKQRDTPQGHGFGSLGMSDRDIRDLVAFLQTELIDMNDWIDQSGRFKGTTATGEQHYTRGSGAAMQCIVCHGPKGMWRNFGTPEAPKWIGTIAAENPQELLHKIRFGQPGSIMPSWIQHGGTVAQAVDIGAYAQSVLPESGSPPTAAYTIVPASGRSGEALAHPLELSHPFMMGNLEPDGRHPLIAHVKICDLDEDGRNDLLSCDVNLGRVIWLQQQTDGTFAEQSIGESIAAPVHAEPADVDGDGDLDVLVASMGVMLPSNQDIGKVIVLENDGDEHFVNRVLLENVRRVTDVRPGDLDGDGDIDLAVSQFGYVQGEVQWLENLGDWNFREHHLMDRSGAIHGPVTDLDGDGDLDIVVLFSQEWETVQAFINDGTGHFTPIVLHDVADADYSSSGLSTGDIDGDGDQDVAWTNGDAFVSVGYRPLPSHGLQWLENRGNLDFAFHRIGDFHGAYGPTIVDLDADGDQDIVTVSEFAYWEEPGTHSLRWWSQQPDGSFVPQDLSTSPTHLVTCDAGDLNRDGLPDIVAGGMALYQPFDRVARIVGWTNHGPAETAGVAAAAALDARVVDALASADDPGERGMILHANALSTHADREYASAEASEPDNARWPYYRGLLDIEVGNSVEALLHLERAAELDRSYPPLQSRLGELYAGQGNVAAAEQAFLAAGDIPMAHLGRARIAFADQDWQQVLATLEGRTIPAAEAMRNAARAHLRGEPPRDSAAVDMGLQYSDSWLDQMRDHALLASTIVVQAQIALIEGDLLRSERLLRRAVAVEPNAPDARLALANALLGHPQATPTSIGEALQHLDRGTRSAPGDVAIRSQRAWALYLLGRHDEAAAEWEAILVAEPAYAPSLLNLGQLHAKAGRHAVALDYYRRGMAVPRDSAFSGSFDGSYRATWLLKQAASAKAVGNMDEAVAVLYKAIVLAPNDPEPRFQYGNAMIGLKRFDQAIPQLEAADVLSPGKPKHLAALGYGLAQSGRLEEAERRLTAATTGAPRYALAWFHLGNVKSQRGDRDGARACFQQAIELRPDFTAAREAFEGME
ncbi:MAG: FG-GAP-like repeat-containing protein [Phycisphaerales bacterium]|jgi:tetratricopeptide (TPR) repeat protein|nr:FG-GAP-like repeat-containing protein [Phycisphaerales bacterium]